MSAGPHAEACRRERERVGRDLKPIYTAVDPDAAQRALEAFDEKWGSRFPVLTQAWLNTWDYVIPFLAFPDKVRRVIYTTATRQPSTAQANPRAFERQPRRKAIAGYWAGDVAGERRQSPRLHSGLQPA